MRAAADGHEVGVGVDGWVGQATMLREGQCKKNQSCTGTKAWKSAAIKNIVHIRPFFAPFSHEWESHANANDTCIRDMLICTQI